MQMQCVSDFANELGAWQAGEVITVSPETAAYLARCSPASWRVGIEAPAPVMESRTETATGVTTLDRMARQGRRRGGRA